MSAYINMHDATDDLSKFKASWRELDSATSLNIRVGASQVTIFLPVDESAFAERIAAAINRTNAPAQTIIADPKPLEALAKAREFIATELAWRRNEHWRKQSATDLLKEIGATLGKGA